MRGNHDPVPETHRGQEPDEVLHGEIEVGGAAGLRGVPFGVRGRGEDKEAAMQPHIPQGLPGQVAATVLGHVSALPYQGLAGGSRRRLPPDEEPGRVRRE